MSLMTRVFLMGLAAGNLALGADFEFKELESLLKSPGVSRVEDVIARLPEKMKSSYVLMRRSNSLQAASDRFPRVILFNQNASLLMAFSGDPQSASYYRMEVAHFLEGKDQWEFRQVNFYPNSSVDSRPYLSSENPAQCVACHQKELRPNWEPYPFWPGAVGEDDRITDDDKRWLRNFESWGGGHTRYSKLRRAENLSRIESSYDRSMAFRLHSLLSGYNTKRLAAWLKKTKDYETYKFAILGVLADCDNIPGFIADEKLGSQQLFDRLKRDTEDKLKAAPSAHTRLLSEVDYSIFAGIRFLFETRGIDLSSWSSSLDQRYLFATVSGVLMRDIHEALRYPDLDFVLAPLDYPSLLRHYRRKSYLSDYSAVHGQHMKDYCDFIRSRSLRNTK